MTRTRAFGCDAPFLDWLRSNPLIDSVAEGISVTDVDVVIHQYKTGVVDAQARRDGYTRNLQALMAVEVKTRNGVPRPAQQDTLWKWSLTIKNKVNVADWTIRNFGWSFVSMSGERPDDSGVIRWGRFDIHGEILWRDINESQLTELMAFRIHPENFAKNVFRRHHKTENIWKIEQTPLGLTIPALEVRRS